MTIKFLASSPIEGNCDKIILLKQIPRDPQSTMHAVRNAQPHRTQQTRLDEEKLEIELQPSNYWEHVDEYLLHVVERVDLNQAVIYLYCIEHNAFRSIRKFIVDLNILYKEENKHVCA